MGKICVQKMSSGSGACGGQSSSSTSNDTQSWQTSANEAAILCTPHYAHMYIQVSLLLLVPCIPTTCFPINLS